MKIMNLLQFCYYVDKKDVTSLVLMNQLQLPWKDNPVVNRPD